MSPTRPLQPDPALFACALDPALDAIPGAARWWERGRAWSVCWRSFGVPPLGFAEPPAHAIWTYRVVGLDAAGGQMLLVVTAQEQGDPGWYELRCDSATMQMQSLRRVDPDGPGGRRSDVSRPADAVWKGDRADDGAWRGTLEAGRRRFSAERRWSDGDPWWSETTLRAGEDVVLIGEIVPPHGINPIFTPRWEKGTSWNVRNRSPQINVMNPTKLRMYEELWRFEVVATAETKAGVACFHVVGARAPEDPEARPYPRQHLWIARATFTVTALEEEYGKGAFTSVSVPAPGDAFVKADRFFYQGFDWPRLPAAFVREERSIDLGGGGPTRQVVTFEGADVMRVELRHPFARDTLVVQEEWRRHEPWPRRVVRTMELADVPAEQCLTAELV